MSADDELRQALATRLPDLQPDVEGELERLLARADSVVRRRRTAYVAGLVAAAIVIAGLVLGHAWHRNADEPEPVDDTPRSARPLEAERGFYADPSALAPGRYRARALGSVYPAVQLDLDLPAGWGQDDMYAVATGPGDDAATRRIDALADVRRIEVLRCGRARAVPTGPGTLDLATALASLGGDRSSEPTPVRLAGYAGYRLRLAGAGSSCSAGSTLREGSFRGIVRLTDAADWTNRVWVIDVDGVHVLINASNGPDATAAQKAELVEIVESISFVVQEAGQSVPSTLRADSRANAFQDRRPRSR